MNILILGNQAKAMGNFWSVLIRRMSACGHEVLCLTPPGDVEAEARLLALGVRLRHYPLDRKGLNPLHDVRTLAALIRLFRSERPDMLFAYTIKPVIYGCLAARLTSVPHVYATITGLGYAFEADTLLKKGVNLLSRFLYGLALARAEGIFFQNEDDVRVFRQAGILKPDARTLLARGTGVDTRRFQPVPFPELVQAASASSGPVFLLVARLLEAKGLEEYAAAAHMLKTTYPQARFQLLGPREHGLGSVSPERLRQWQEEGSLEYLGETQDVRPHIAAAHVLVLPSWREGTPTAIMEGMSMGRPAVVTDVPGCREVVRHGENGFLVPLRNAEALARAMERFILKPEIIVRMGAAGRERACREFDAETVAAGIMHAMRIA
ncbi:MAG: glycosyltransferase family 4 protein [Desulfovibrio sp.]|nr:glycosyltransferase family 4 protein [Desulfovibrio sp.]